MSPRQKREPPSPRKFEKVSPRRTLEDLRRRAAAGLAMDRPSVRNTGLFERARRDFGTWGRALLAAGLRPSAPVPGRPLPRPPAPPLQALTAAMLRSGLAIRAICRVTGLAPKTVRERRRRLGIAPAAPSPRPPRPEGRVAPAEWDPMLPRPLGSPTSVADRLRSRIARVPLASLRRALRRLEARHGRVLRRRLFELPPPTLAALAGEWGVTRQRVAQIELAALRELVDAVEA